MAGNLSDIVQLTITQDAVGLARLAFGIPLILSYNADFAERVRTYSSLTEVGEDFDDDMPEYLAARAMFSQSPHVTSVKIGRGTLKPTLAYEIAATAADSTDYDITVSGEGMTETDVTYTSDSAATVAEIHSGLVTALNAVASNNYIAAFEALVVGDTVFTADNGTETFTAAAHGLLTGDGPVRVSNAGGALPTGLLAATDYWVIKLTDNTFQLATSLANALAGTPQPISTDGTGTQTLSDTADTVRPSEPITVTGDAAGDWFSLAIDNANLLSIKMTHTDPGVATDLAAISVEDDNWYALITFWNSKAYVAGCAAHIEPLFKIYPYDTLDTTALTTSYVDGNEGDALAQQHTLARERVTGWYHPSPADMLHAALTGLMLSFDPGSATWKFKTLSGVSPVTLTSTHRTNIRARKGNSYETFAGRNMTWEGYRADGDFIDVTQGIDWIYDDMTKGVAEGLAANAKVPFDDDGITAVETKIRGTLKRATDRNILAADPAFTVTVPRARNVASASKAIRHLPDVKWAGTLAGAIHSVAINGVVSV